MGCCISRPRGPNSPYHNGPGGAASGSARAINDASAVNNNTNNSINNASPSSGGQSPVLGRNPASLTGSGRRRGGGNSSTRRHSSHHHQPQQPLSQHINRPLRRPEWTSQERTWTAAALRRERIEFFDTRVTGRQEVWQALFAALEVLWTAETAARRRKAGAAAVGTPTAGGGGYDEGPSGGEEDPAVALATAQSILDAADITLPTGDLAQGGAYDALGNYYHLPQEIVSDPVNVVDGGRRRRRSRKEDGLVGDDKGGLTDEAGDTDGGDADDDYDEDGDDDDDVLGDAAERRREEKGKAVVDVRDLISVRARLSDGSKDVVVSIGKGETVRSIARRICEEAHLSDDKKVRIAYMGKILKEATPLAVQGWKQGHVVNALVFNR